MQRNNLCCYDYTLKGKYTNVAYSLTGGNILRWMRDELGQTEIARATETGQNPYTLLLDAMPYAPTDLLVLPYFSATGTPYFDTRAKGAIIGLQLTTCGLTHLGPPCIDEGEQLGLHGRFSTIPSRQFADLSDWEDNEYRFKVRAIIEEGFLFDNKLRLEREISSLRKENALPILQPGECTTNILEIEVDNI